MPVKLKFGYLTNLVLKVPWKNLYTEPVIASIEGLHLLVVPNLGPFLGQSLKLFF